MNVRICSFPEGEDPDSFAKSHSLDEIKTYLLDEAKDFIQFKTDLLLKEAANDPVKKGNYNSGNCSKYFQNSRCY